MWLLRFIRIISMPVRKPFSGFLRYLQMSGQQLKDHVFLEESSSLKVPSQQAPQWRHGEGHCGRINRKLPWRIEITVREISNSEATPHGICKLHRRFRRTAIRPLVNLNSVIFSQPMQPNCWAKVRPCVTGRWQVRPCRGPNVD